MASFGSPNEHLQTFKQDILDSRFQQLSYADPPTVHHHGGQPVPATKLIHNQRYFALRKDLGQRFGLSRTNDV